MAQLSIARGNVMGFKKKRPLAGVCVKACYMAKTSRKKVYQVSVHTE